MYAGLDLIIPPSSEPVSVADAKLHSRIDVDSDNGTVAGYISAARQYCESRTNRALMTQSWRLALRAWPGRNYLNPENNNHNDSYRKHSFIELPRPPLQSITSFTYADVLGVTASMSQSYSSAVGNYLLDTDSEPGRIYLPFSGLWPTTILAPGIPILITYVAGYPSFSGTVTVDTDGLGVRWATGNKFSPLMAGTFIQIGGASSTVAAWTSDTRITLAQPVAITGTPAYSANAVPHPIKQAILFMAAHLYENREPVVVGRGVTSVEVSDTMDALLGDYRNFHAVQPSAA